VSQQPTIEIETTEVTTGIEASQAPGQVTTIVTTDAGDGESAPVVTVSTVTSEGPTTVEVTALEPVTLVEIASTGTPGAPGQQGEQGQPGDAGMVFVQDMPLTLWTIPHPFQHWPDVSVVDTAGNVIAVEVSQAPGVVSIHTVLPTAGRAFLI
jgi:hypothetical protein